MQRYTVDLSNVFSDHRRKVFVGRRHQWKHIACLLEHIRSVFHLSSHIYLTNSEKILFPEEEDLDVILKSDQLVVHPSNSLSDTHQISAPKIATDGESRVTVVNGKRKRDSLPKLKPASSKKAEESESDSDSDDDEDNVLPKVFLESISRQDESTQELPKPKRKRTRKRKAKKVATETPPKVVVKTHGKSKEVPAVVTDNGTRPSHVRFNNGKAEVSDDENESASPAENEPYRNLNKITVPRVIKAVVQQSVPMTLNDETPCVPDYDDIPDLNSSGVVVKHKPQSKLQSGKRKNSLEIKQELIETNKERSVSPTWDSEMRDAKETFLSAYSGEEFWATLQEALDNFPNITIPSVNDIIAYRIDAQPYLSLVERVVDGESDDLPALKLTMLQLNGAPTAQPAKISVTLDRLSEIRLVATYQP